MDAAIVTDADMLAKVDAFCEQHSMKPTTFGRLAIGDGSLIPNLRAGRSITLRMASRIAEFMAAYGADQSEPMRAAG